MIGKDLDYRFASTIVLDRVRGLELAVPANKDT